MRVAAERQVSRAMGGSCSMPLAAYATWSEGEQGALQLEAAWGDLDGGVPVIRVRQEAAPVTLAEAESLGQRAADALMAAGAKPAKHD